MDSVTLQEAYEANMADLEANRDRWKKRVERLEAVLTNFINAHVCDLGHDCGASLDGSLDEGPRNQQWVLGPLDRAIVEALVVLENHPFASRAREIIAMDDEWRQKLWPNATFKEYKVGLPLAPAPTEEGR